MHSKKLRLVLVLVVCLVMASFTACGNKGTTAPKDQKAEEETKEDKKISVVTTIFPSYDWVREVMGENADKADITLLTDGGVDLHNYEPTADDIVKISSADMFIYVGGESDDWVEDALKEAENKDMKVINLLEILDDDAKEEEVKEGMENDEEEEPDDDEDEDEAEDAVEYDEHVWLSLDNAEDFVEAIEEGLSEIDPANKDFYEENADAYEDKLDELDDRYEDVVDDSSKKTLIFGDRFPFRYLVDDYDLDYYAAFLGCSAETEASFETIVFLANKVDELGLKYILTIENSDGKIADTIIQNTKDKNQEVLVMNSMQSIGSEDMKKGVSYLSIMEDNLKVLEKALQ